MMTIMVSLAGFVVGGIAGILFGRRNVKKVEVAVGEAGKVIAKLETEVAELKKKIGL